MKDVNEEKMHHESVMRICYSLTHAVPPPALGKYISVTICISSTHIIHTSSCGTVLPRLLTIIYTVSKSCKYNLAAICNRTRGKVLSHSRQILFWRFCFVCVLSISDHLNSLKCEHGWEAAGGWYITTPPNYFSPCLSTVRIDGSVRVLAIRAYRQTNPG